MVRAATAMESRAPASMMGASRKVRRSPRRSGAACPRGGPAAARRRHPATGAGRGGAVLLRYGHRLGRPGNATLRGPGRCRPATEQNGAAPAAPGAARRARRRLGRPGAATLPQRPEQRAAGATPLAPALGASCSVATPPLPAARLLARARAAFVG